MKWKLVGSEKKYQGFFSVEECHVRHQTYKGDEVEIKRELFHRGDAVAVLLYDPAKDKVVLIEQFRMGAINNEDGPWLLEIVAGVVEEGESITDVARRECQERLASVCTVLSRYTVSIPAPADALKKYMCCVHWWTVTRQKEFMALKRKVKILKSWFTIMQSCMI